MHWFTIRLPTCGSLASLLTGPLPLAPPGAEARTSRQLAAKQPSKWAHSHSSCSCHNTGQLLSKSMLCTHNTSTYAHRRSVLAPCIQQPLTKFTVCCFTPDQSWGLGGKFRIKVWKSCCCSTFAALKCLANLGLCPCSRGFCFFFFDIGSLMFQRLQNPQSMKTNLSTWLLPAAFTLILMLLLLLGILTLRFSAIDSVRSATNCAGSAWLDRFSLNEWRASVCFTLGSHLIPGAFVFLNCVEFCTRTLMTGTYWDESVQTCLSGG